MLNRHDDLHLPIIIKGRKSSNLREWFNERRLITGTYIIVIIVVVVVVDVIQ